ncbi:MAG: purine-binding chemotaxis protein CheW [Candidatus Dadabacteria bacterium]|nr:MAG: purine-binding chemotaxis protein CheW [Candidatus Dadabacteria bacterium]
METTDGKQEGQVKQQEGAGRLAGKYLRFKLAGEYYAVNIMRVVEIFRVMEITRVPRCPDYLKGVINLRGKIIPVVDLRLKFGLEEKEHDDHTCIIVVNIQVADEQVALGVIVDTVLEVKDYSPDMLAEAPDYGASVDTSFITGMGRQEDGSVTILLDVDRILAGTENESLRNFANEQQQAG